MLVFLGLALTEEVVAQQHTPMNARIIAACSAGLLAGPWVGAAVGVGSTLMALGFQGTPPAGFGLATALGGLAGGWAGLSRPAWALRPTTGLLIGVPASLSRYPLAAAFAALFGLKWPPLSLGMEALTALVNGTGVALLLLVVRQVLAREAAARAAAEAEVRALRARMDPHFLFNALNSVAALSAVDPDAVPGALARLADFLRGSLEQHDRPLVTLREELGIVAAYLAVESLRFDERLRVERRIAAEAADALVPPFLAQPLVENAVRHGIEPSKAGGLVRLSASVDGPHLALTVRDTGVGIPAPALAEILGGGPGGSHALGLLRRRLVALYGEDFALEIRSRVGHGTVVRVRIPLRRGPVAGPAGRAPREGVAPLAAAPAR